MTDAENFTTADIAADIAAHAADAVPSPELAAKMRAFYESRGEELAHLRLIFLGYAAKAIEAGMMEGVEQEVASRVVANELEFAAAITVRSMYRQLGQPMLPARFALVAYVNAMTSAHFWESDAARFPALSATEESATESRP